MRRGGVVSVQEPDGADIVSMSPSELFSISRQGGDDGDVLVLDSTAGGIAPVAVRFDGGDGANSLLVTGDSGTSGRLSFNIGTASNAAASTVTVFNADVVFYSTQHISALTITGGGQAK